MLQYTFAKDYKDKEVLRNSFFELAASTFGIDFNDWYRKGAWTDRYIPYSFIDKERVIANVSVNLLNLIIHGERKSAVQIGTVMTHPDYRGKGLSSSLMHTVLEEYENCYDFLYLFANDEVLNFYPKFGFTAVQEHLYSVDSLPIQAVSPAANIRKLAVDQDEDYKLIRQFASERLPNSRLFGTDNTDGLFLYYCLNVFRDYIYYLEQEDVLAIYQQSEHHTDIYDIIFRNSNVNLPIIMSKIAGRFAHRVNFHFSPDLMLDTVNSQADDSGLFVKAKQGMEFPTIFKHPVTSIA